MKKFRNSQSSKGSESFDSFVNVNRIGTFSNLKLKTGSRNFAAVSTYYILENKLHRLSGIPFSFKSRRKSRPSHERKQKKKTKKRNQEKIIQFERKYGSR